MFRPALVTVFTALAAFAQAPLEDLDGVGGLGAPLGLQHLAEGAVAQEAQRSLLYL